MSYSNDELRSMLEDVVNALDLSASMIQEHGQLGTPPAELVKMVLAQKDKQIAMLKNSFSDLTTEGNK